MAEQITITIETGNAAFDDSPTGEIARILRELADHIEYSGLPDQQLCDINGNTVGGVRVEELK